MTPTERIDTIGVYAHDTAHTVIRATARIILADADAAIIDARDLLEMSVRGALQIGIELGLRAAFLDPVAAERIRDAYGPGLTATQGNPEAIKDHIASALADAQRFLDLAGRP